MASSSTRRRAAVFNTFCVKKEQNAIYRQVAAALQKAEVERTDEEKDLLKNHVDLVEQAAERQKKRQEVKARSEEVEDPEDVLTEKCKELAAALRSARHLVVYTGAGISTAAKIPDYRGSNGIWTLLQKGKDIGSHDLSQAEPTLTHMALFQLYLKGILKYVVSQNCDGLHLRSGLPRCAISEVHGNMHIEVCRQCRPCVQYWRLFDVTENTGRFSHRTMRRCHICHAALLDTIVHFGERGSHPWPLNWPSASKAADNADMILCIGSSLKVLKKYPWLWGMDKPARKRPKVYIINLQWTPKDDHAALKINGRCDRIMQEVMKHLEIDIPTYDRLRDPIFRHATWLHPGEEHTTSQPELDSPLQRETPSTGEGEPPLKREKRDELPCGACSEIKKEEILYEDGKNSLFECNKAVEIEVKMEKEEAMEIDRYVSDVNLAGLSVNCGDLNLVLKQEEIFMYQEAVSSTIQQFPESDVLFLISSSTTEETVIGCDILKKESANKTRMVDKIRRDVSNDGIDSLASKDKENRDVAIEVANDLKSAVKTPRERTNSRNSEKENCSDDKDESQAPKDDDAVKGSKSSNVQNGANSCPDLGVLRNLQVEHNYSKACHVYSKEEGCEGMSDTTPTRTSNRVREKLAAAQKPKKEEPASTKPTPKPQSKDKDKITKADYEIKVTKCSFCLEVYLSPVCLFYPSFNSQPWKFEGCICECCDYSESEEEQEEEEEDSKEGRGSDNGEEQTSKAQVINPGWYGKGYKKRKKRK